MISKIQYIRSLDYGPVKCNICKNNCTPCMLNNKIWKKVSKDLTPNLDYKDLSAECKFLCLLCVEDILQRPLEKSDFSGYEQSPINNGIMGFDYNFYLRLK